MVDIVNDRASGDLADNPGQVNGADTEPGGVERDVVVLNKVVRQQADEADEDFLHALGRLAVYNGTLLRVLQVKQEDGIEHAQHLDLIDMVGMNIVDDFAHFCYQTLCGI